ncbi:MAG: 16S rRNA (cytidine(1402)-2'-O)-methyltransferase [Candidatus Kerfeldbacteria bacterium RIFCSPHIGHO2_12_FULL_48_17]|uniref:Ribosomal RNA small subunit methyltransferase I n=1 Tax=Candidatus Kerfeldbacteria bacterium RIFCSPHIGHO2_12_FULL_48_17 TaxID=1798542 RepID=A0A1G2B4U0_9BACT|nr:MAG: 16S rRNA (cytidine(1402)-2'-O)-methyltransferase [Candidatus Kerfeldbacteria bacterium RIFCSPHIGHO2_12_FULL_48_17]
MAKLFIVATPVGNLGDITVRALDTLKTVYRIACEDTRQTQKLLRHYGITTPTLSYHQHSGVAKTEAVVARLRAGEDMALVTDAGTPGISDPGYALIAAALAAGVEVVPIPGPAALIAALSASGLDTHQFHFLGFLPHKKGRQTLFRQIADSSVTTVFYESPHRIVKTLLALAASFGEDRQVVVARELTKIHEEFVRGSAQEIHDQLVAKDAVRGEFVVMVSALGTAALRPHDL